MGLSNKCSLLIVPQNIRKETQQSLPSSNLQQTLQHAREVSELQPPVHTVQLFLGLKCKFFHAFSTEKVCLMSP